MLSIIVFLPSHGNILHEHWGLGWLCWVFVVLVLLVLLCSVVGVVLKITFGVGDNVSPNLSGGNSVFPHPSIPACWGSGDKR